MSTLNKVIGILVGAGTLYGLYATNVINGQSAIMVALITIIFLFVTSDLKNGLQNKISNVGKTVSNISMYIITRDGLSAGYFTTGSPIMLAPLAQKVLEESGARAIIDTDLDSLLSRIASRNPKDELDVRNKSYPVAEELTANESFTPVRNFIYEHWLRNICVEIKAKSD
jgi:hypothetical protein